jgi:hypothetical protein
VSALHYQRIGISNALPQEISVLYSRVPSRGSFGRIADLCAHAAIHENQLDTASADMLALRIHALLSGVFTLAKGSGVFFEMAAPAHEFLISSRFSIQELIQNDEFPMGIEVWVREKWMKSDVFQPLRALMGPVDRIEVRFNMTLKLVEWRWVRKRGVHSLKEGEEVFYVIADEADKIYQNSELPKELSDLPFDRWLEEVYKTNSKFGTAQGAGEIFFRGESIQNETEVSRVITSREKKNVEDTVNKEMDKSCWEDGIENLDLKNRLKPEDEVRVEAKAEEIVSHIEEVKDERAREIIQDTKRRELRAKHDLIVIQRKSEKYEALLEEKEKMIQRKAMEIRHLNAKLLEKTGSDEFTESAQRFKEKALQMAEALKRSKEDNEALEKLVFELRQKNRVMEAAGEAGMKMPAGGPVTVAQQQIEDLVKKADRISRALEAEKAKVISLSERLATAEKEAQAAGPMIEDLEAKVEHTLKVAQQHKKETEQVKQKLVQSDAEKNKVKNELVKAQAQIQTLMKRQAS